MCVCVCVCVCDVYSSAYLHSGNIELTLFIHVGGEDVEPLFWGGEVFVLICSNIKHHI